MWFLKEGGELGKSTRSREQRVQRPGSGDVGGLNDLFEEEGRPVQGGAEVRASCLFTLNEPSELPSQSC